MSQDIENYVKSCNTCLQLQKDNQQEKWQHLLAPSRPWMEVGTDIFHVPGSLCSWLLLRLLWLYRNSFFNVIIYYNRIQEIVFTAWHPRNFSSSNLFNSFEFKDFEKQWQFIREYPVPIFKVQWISRMIYSRSETFIAKMPSRWRRLTIGFVTSKKYSPWLSWFSISKTNGSQNKNIDTSHWWTTLILT